MYYYQKYCSYFIMVILLTGCTTAQITSKESIPQEPTPQEIVDKIRERGHGHNLGIILDSFGDSSCMLNEKECENTFSKDPYIIVQELKKRDAIWKEVLEMMQDKHPGICMFHPDEEECQ